MDPTSNLSLALFLHAVKKFNFESGKFISFYKTIFLNILNASK